MGDAQVVSFEDEPLILVDSADQILGYESKAACHDGAGKLHRAFSVFLVDDTGAVLLQRRAAGKRLWPGYWANSCCSHPRRGETDADAATRRVREELGCAAQLRQAFRFEYRASFGAEGTEHELCTVWFGRADGPVVVNAHEIAEIRWVSPDRLTEEIQGDPSRFTPWLLLEWPRVAPLLG